MNKNVFREYDIRGIVEVDFPPQFVIDLGRAFGTYLLENNQNNVSISGDIRHTTSRLKQNLIEGLLHVGINVFDMGTLPTPINYFSLYNTNITNSIQVTGSHNPKEFNGFKISFNKKPFFGKDIEKLKNIIINNSFIHSSSKGKYDKVDIIDQYSDFLIKDINIENDINCVMDCGNSVGGIIAPQIFKELKIGLKELYCDIDPNFSNHHPDPTVDENLKDIIEELHSNTYTLGVAYDGDADRVVAVDEKGGIIRADILMSIFIPHIISKNDTVLYDVKCSQSLELTIKKYFGKPLMWKTGHSLIKNKMIETNSKFGGEMSGHIFFADRYFGYDDGIYVSLRLIELLSKSKYNLSQLVEQIPKFYSSPEIRIPCSDDIVKFKIVDKVKTFYTKNNYDCILIDGVRIKFNYGWGLIRVSNTQPVIVCRFEADSKDNLLKIQDNIFGKIREYGDRNIEL